MKKIFVKVYGSTDMNGKVLPYMIELEDKRQFFIDDLVDSFPAASAAGGQGIKYCCLMVQYGREFNLFNDADGLWFIEAMEEKDYVRKVSNCN